ncbi:MAG: Serine/threonine protein kinase PrkC, regulator of stationary phase [Labilithrix sp.]|nr:Serine/threonine protein kinase PrkC, regulator of stationary phase [Labilithrix sp.]
MSEYAMPKVGDVIAGKYRLEQVAGEGGMGIVYAAEHLVLRQRVAVKVLLPDAATSEMVVERFAREAQAAARIQSEHVARVMDAGSTATGAPFLVMEYLEGCDLEELLSVEGPLPLTDVVDYLMQALEALAHAHAVGLVHRDIKPANLFLACRPDGGNVIKILDFGISKAMRSRPEEKVLTGQAVLGSPVYMSPEQLRNAKDIDARADVWSLGVVAYELLTGKPPFDGDGVGEIFAAILEKDPEPVHIVNWRLPPEISAVIAKCLQRKVEDRWGDAAELARALKPYGSGAWTSVVDRAEQVLTRAKLFKRPETPSEARRVVDALNAVAERARTMNGAGALAAAADATPIPAVKNGDAGRDTREDGVKTRARGFVWRLGRARSIAVAAAAVMVIGAVATVATVRSGRAASAEQRAPLRAAVSNADSRSAASQGAGGASGRPDDGTGEAADQGTEGADGDGAPMVMDLPDTPGQTGDAKRSRNAKPAKPQRPKFLNTRE